MSVRYNLNKLKTVGGGQLCKILLVFGDTKSCRKSLELLNAWMMLATAVEFHSVAVEIQKILKSKQTFSKDFLISCNTT